MVHNLNKACNNLDGDLKPGSCSTSADVYKAEPICLLNASESKIAASSIGFEV